jgi:hypothetical protein
MVGQFKMIKQCAPMDAALMPTFKEGMVFTLSIPRRVQTKGNNRVLDATTDDYRFRVQGCGELTHKSKKTRVLVMTMQEAGGGEWEGPYNISAAMMPSPDKYTIEKDFAFKKSVMMAHAEEEHQGPPMSLCLRISNAVRETEATSVADEDAEEEGDEAADAEGDSSDEPVEVEPPAKRRALAVATPVLKATEVEANQGEAEAATTSSKQKGAKRKQYGRSTAANGGAAPAGKHQRAAGPEVEPQRDVVAVSSRVEQDLRSTSEMYMNMFTKLQADTAADSKLAQDRARDAALEAGKRSDAVVAATFKLLEAKQKEAAEPPAQQAATQPPHPPNPHPWYNGNQALRYHPPVPQRSGYHQADYATPQYDQLRMHNASTHNAPGPYPYHQQPTNPNNQGGQGNYYYGFNGYANDYHQRSEMRPPQNGQVWSDGGAGHYNNGQREAHLPEGMQREQPQQGSHAANHYIRYDYPDEMN